MSTEPEKIRVTERLRWRLAALCLLGSCLSWPGVSAANGPQFGTHGAGPGLELLAQRATRISKDEAAAIVRSRTGGRILGVRTRSRGNRLTYRVKVLDKGRVSVYEVDGATGEIRR